jgi:diguanylate cyclase (GGDEF)-like protein
VQPTDEVKNARVATETESVSDAPGARVGEGYDRAMTLRLPTIAGCLAVLAAVQAVVGGVLLSGLGSYLSAPLGLLCAAILTWVALLTQRSRLRSERGRSYLAAAVLLPALVGCLQLGWGRQGWAAGSVAIVMVAASVIFTDRRRFLGVVLGSWVAWLAGCVAALSRHPLTLTDALSATVAPTLVLLVATALAGLIRAGLVDVIDAVDAGRDRLEQVAVRDELTGTANRRGLEMLATPMIENARRQGEAVHCLSIDVDAFAKVNEALGHERGNAVLMAVAEAVNASIRSTDVVARLTGDAFVVFGPGTGMSPLELERRVRAKLTAQATVPAEVWQPRVSVGAAALVPWDSGDLESLLRRADQDMYLRRSLRRQTTIPRRPTPRPPQPTVPETPEA